MRFLGEVDGVMIECEWLGGWMWVGRWVGRWGRWVVGVMGWVVMMANFFYLINAALRIIFPPAAFFHCSCRFYLFFQRRQRLKSL